MLTFDEAFDRLIGHESGYVNNPAVGLQYVNEQSFKDHSRIRGGDAVGAGVGCTRPLPCGRIHLHPANELTRVRLSGARVRAASLCQRPMQRPLHPPPERLVDGGPGSRPQAWRCVRRVRRADRRKGRMGPVSAPLQASQIRDAERRCRCRFRVQVRPLQRIVSSGSFRLSSSRGQAWLAERDVPQQLAQHIVQRAGQVHSSLRQLPQTGAPR